jgi:hypothetical protein
MVHYEAGTFPKTPEDTMENPSQPSSPSTTPSGKNPGYARLALRLLRGGGVGVLSLALLGVKFAGGVREMGIKGARKLPVPGPKAPEARD